MALTKDQLLSKARSQSNQVYNPNTGRVETNNNIAENEYEKRERERLAREAQKASAVKSTAPANTATNAAGSYVGNYSNNANDQAHYAQREEALKGLSNEDRQLLNDYVYYGGIAGGARAGEHNKVSKNDLYETLRASGHDDNTIKNFIQYQKEIQRANDTQNLYDFADSVTGKSVVGDIAAEAASLGLRQFGGWGATIGTWVDNAFKSDKTAPTDTNSAAYALQNLGQRLGQNVNQDIYENAGDALSKVMRTQQAAVNLTTSALGMDRTRKALNAVTGAATNVADNYGGEVAADAFMIADNMLNNMVGRRLKGGSTLPTFFSEAYAQSIKENQEKGTTDSKAKLAATAAAAAEVIYELVPTERWVKLSKSGATATKDFIKELAISSGLEGTSELATDLTNLLTDYLINGDLSDVKNKSPEEIRKGLILTFLSGGASGFGSNLMAGAMRRSSYKKSAPEMNKLLETSNYREFAEGIDTDPNNYRNAEELEIAQTAKETALNLADKADKGEEISDVEKGGLYQYMEATQYYAAQAEQETAQRQSNNVAEEVNAQTNEMSRNGSEEVTVPSEYRNNVSTEEASSRMINAQSAQELAEAYNVARNSNVADQNKIDNALGFATSHLQNKGVAVRDIEAALNAPTETTAYNAGFSGAENTFIDNPTLGRAYNEGRMAAIKAKSEEKSGLLGTINGEKARITKFNADGTVETTKGIANLSDVQPSSYLFKELINDMNKTMFSADLRTEILNGAISTDMAGNRYNQAAMWVAKGSIAGIPMSRIESLHPEIKTMPNRQAIYDAAAQEEMDRYGKRKPEGKNTPIRKTGVTGNVDEKVRPLLEAVSNATGIQINVEELLKNVGGQLKDSQGELSVNKNSDKKVRKLWHEAISEVIEAYNKKDYRSIRNKILQYVLDTDPDTFARAVVRYQYNYEQTYIDTEGKAGEQVKLADDAINEIVNDVIADIMATEEGTEKLADYLKNKNQNSKSIIEKIVDFFKDIVDHFKELASGEKNSEIGQIYLDAADNLSGMIDDIVKAWDIALENRDAAVANSEGTADGKIAYSLDDSEKTKIASEVSRLTKVIDSIVAKKFDTQNNIQLMSYTPSALLKVQIENHPIYMTYEHYKDVTHKKGNQQKWHGIDNETLKRIPELISDPAFIIDSYTKDDSIVVITDEVDDTNDKWPIVVSITLNGKATIKQNHDLTSNFATSVYGKKGFIDWINTAQKENRILYVGNKKSHSLYNKIGKKYPSDIAKLGFDKIIHPTNNYVNAKYLEAVRKGDMVAAKKFTDQKAIKWGAYKNTNAANKIFPQDGAVRVFYHGTNSSDFTVFDKSLLGTGSGDLGYFGKGFYFAFSEKEAETYGDNIIPAYLKMTKPYIYNNLYKMNGKVVNDHGASGAAWVYNIAKEFPNLVKNETVRSYDEEGNLKKLSYDDFVKLYDKVRNEVSFEVLETDEDNTYRVVAGKHTETQKLSDGSEYSWDEYDFEQEVWGKDNAEEEAAQIYWYLRDKYGVELERPKSVIQRLDFSGELQKKGYDSVLQSESGDEAVVFNSNQIKKSDPITFDDDGKPIPLSKRYSTSDDIRYSIEDITEDSDGRKLSEGQQKYFKNEDPLLLTSDGKLKRYYHGTARADRVGTVFRPDRATSGPMAFFTDNPQVAENYSKSKEDTSLAYDNKYDTYEHQFTVNVNGEDLYINDLWNELPAAKRAEIRQRVPHIAFDDDYENIIYDENIKNGNGFISDYEIKRAKNNYLQLLVNEWLESGDLIDQEETFTEVLKLAGVENVEYHDPNLKDEAVYEVYIKAEKVLDTSNIDSEVLDALRKRSETEYYDPLKNANADGWDKNGITPKNWMAQLDEDIKNDTTYTWTRIPDWVTEILKEFGYDAISDKGGKYHVSDLHQVIIPFDSNQVKNVNNLNPTANEDIRYSIEDITEDSKGNELSDAQIEYFKDSKVRDEKGRLLRVYHGTSDFGFTVFDPKKADDGRSMFFTSDRFVAASYSGTETIGDINNIEDSEANYEAYLNVKKPLYVLAQNPDEDIWWEEALGYGLSYDELGDYEKYLKALAEDGTYADDYQSDNYSKLHNMTTREWSEYAQKNGYDGVIFKNIIDSGMYADDFMGAGDASDVFVVFNSNQVKDVNNLNPTQNDDIRYSIEDMIGEEGDPKIVDAAVDAIEGKVTLEDKGISEAEKANITAQASIADEVKKVAQAAKGKEVPKAAIYRISQGMLDRVGSSYDKATLQKNLEGVFTTLANNDEINYEDFTTLVREIARPVIQATYEKDAAVDENITNFKKELRTIRILPSESEKSELAYSVGTYGEFFRHNKGRINLVKENGISIDQAWPEILNLAHKYDIYGLDDIENTTEMLAALSDTIDNYMLLAEQGEKVFQSKGDEDDAAYDLGMYALQKYFEQVALSDMVDKEAKRQIRVAQQEFKDQIESYKKATEKAFDEKVADIKAQYNDDGTSKEVSRLKEQMAILQAKNKMSVKNDVMEMKKSEVTKSVKRTANQLYSMLTQPNDKKHVPDGMQKPLLEFINSIDFVSHRADPNSKASQDWTRKMTNLKDLLDTITDEKKSTGDMVLDSLEFTFDPELAENMADFIKTYGEYTKVSSLPEVGLRELNRILTGLRTQINKVNETYANKTYANRRALGQQTMEDLSKLKDRYDKNKVSQAAKNYKLGLMDSVTYFEELGSGAKSIYNELRDGFSQKVKRVREGQEWFEKTIDELGITSKDLTKWSGKGAEVHTVNVVDIDGGKREISFNDAQLMELYALSRRPQAQSHLANGVIFGKREGETNHQVNAVHLSSTDMTKLFDNLSPKQKALVEKMQQYLSSDCAEWMNNVTKEAYGYSKAKEKFYWPIKVDSDSNKTNDKNASGSMASLKGIVNMSFTKEIQTGAANAIVINDAISTFTDHVTKMATYEGLALPVMDAMGWYNYAERFVGADEDGSRVTDIQVKKGIHRVLGEEGKKWFETFMRDLNGSMVDQGFDGAGDLVKMMVSNVKGVSVMANVRVVVQQPTAIARATMYINPMYLSYGATHALRGAEEAQRMNSMAQWKSWGYYDTFLGQSMKKVITGESTTKERINEKASFLAQKADDITWGAIWEAVKAETKAKTNIKPGTDEFYEAVNKRFDEIIDHTQVVDTVFTKPSMLRSKNQFTQAATAFMMEPVKNVNMLMRAFDSKEKRAKAIQVYILSTILTQVVASLWDAVRADDDETSYIERFLDALLGITSLDDLKNFNKDTAKAIYFSNLVSGLNPINLLPFIKEINSVAQGFTPSRSELQGLSDAVSAIGKLTKYIQAQSGEGKTQYTAYGIAKIVAKPVSELTGLPIYSAWRDIEAATNEINNYIDGWDNPVSTHSTSAYYPMWNAVDKNGDISGEVGKLLEAGKEKSQIKSSLKNHYAEEYKADIDVDPKEASELWNKVEKALGAAGYDKDEIAHTKQEWTEGRTISTYTYVHDAIEGNGDISKAVKDVMASGKDKGSVSSALTSKYKPKMQELYKTDIKAAGELKQKLLKAYQAAGYTFDDANKKINDWLK